MVNCMSAKFTRCSVIRGSGQGRGSGQSVAADKVKCPICAQVWPALEMRQHMGYHILHTPSSLVTANPCGFCGGDAASCRSWLEKTGPTVNARTRCVLLGGVAGEGKLNYSHGSAWKPSAQAPCTNHLTPCNHCKPEQNAERPVFWSYNLTRHHDKEHPSHPRPPAGYVDPQEKDLVKAVGGERRGLTSDEKGIIKLLRASKEARAKE
eukprot:392835-Prymnesium_polylepis.1